MKYRPAIQSGAARAAHAGAVTCILPFVLAACVALPPPQEWLGDGPGDAPGPAAMPVGDSVSIERLDWSTALRLARERSPSIESAAARLEKARQMVREAAALAYPTLDARASWVRFLEAADFRGRSSSEVGGAATRTRFFTGRGSDIYSAGVDANYPIFDGGRVYYGKEAARSAVRSAREEREAVRRDLDRQVSLAFLNVLLSRGAIEIATESLAFTKGEETRAAARAEAGEGLKIDALRFRTRASSEQLQLNQALATRRVRIAILSELLDVPLAEDVEFVEPKSAFTLEERDSAARALAHRPELKAVAWRVAELEQELARENASWWPTFSFFGSYGVLNLDSLDVSQATDEFQVGAAMAMNLFEGGGTTARAAVIRQRVAEERSEERRLRLEIERQVREAAINVEVDARNVEVSRETVRLAEEVLDRVTARYRAGEAQVLDVTEAELERTRARLALLRSRVHHVLSQVRLLHAEGDDLMPAIEASMDLRRPVGTGAEDRSTQSAQPADDGS